VQAQQIVTALVKGEGVELPKAGVGKRLLAFLVDAIILGTVFFAIFLIFGSNLTLEGTFALCYFSSIFLSMIYFTYFYSTSGQTLGKKLLRIKVISSDEDNLYFATGIIRYIGYYISALLVLVGFLMIFFNKEKQGLHDKLAATYVVSVPKKEDEKENIPEGKFSEG